MRFFDNKGIIPFFAVVICVFLWISIFEFPVVEPRLPSAKSLSELRNEIDSKIEQAKFSAAIWGIEVKSLETGRTIYENHPDRLMSPASNSKLFVGALALASLGGDHRIITPISVTAKPDKNGIIFGDLIVTGQGDPSWKDTNY